MEASALAELYQKLAPAIFVHCRRILRSPAAASDATQEVFVRVLSPGRALPTGDELLRYLYRISTNVCLNQLRANRRHAAAAPALALRQGTASIEGDHAARQFVSALLDRTDETGAAVAVMHYIDGMSQVEIAETLGITRRTVFNRLRKLEALAARLLAPAAPGFVGSGGQECP
jgi:RNA polymerase sigma-70 factor, ECF subfamily